MDPILGAILGWAFAQALWLVGDIIFDWFYRLRLRRGLSAAGNYVQIFRTSYKVQRPGITPD